LGEKRKTKRARVGMGGQQAAGYDAGGRRVAEKQKNERVLGQKHVRPAGRSLRHRWIKG